VERAERIVDKLLQLDPNNPSICVLMANIYAAAGQYQDADRYRLAVIGVKRQPGVTWCEFNGRIFQFGAHDKLNHVPEYKEQIMEKVRFLRYVIYIAQIDEFKSKLNECNHIAQTHFVLKVMNTEEKEHDLCSHSEKLALAFMMVATPPGTPVILFKNLRVCGDCHAATKLLSSIYQRKLTVRDANRWHIMSNGKCSCGDYF